MKQTPVVDISNSDLVVEVTNVLSGLGHNRPSDWIRYLEPEAHTCGDNEYIRFLINRAFRLILGNCVAENTMNARYCLIERANGDINQWMTSFKEGVAPVIVKLSLPPAMN